MSLVEILSFDEPVVSFDWVDTPQGEIWIFLTPKNLLIHRAKMNDLRPHFDKKLTLQCYNGSATSAVNERMLVVATDNDVYVLISNSLYLLILISFVEMKPKVLQSHMAPVTGLVHIQEEFAISASEDNSISGWDLSQGNLIFKIPFLYIRPACILSSVSFV